ncbi:metallophosphoesterase [Lentilactobacillus sp. SPB1-3]|uniref:Metallophosphoesterase n=1 Tax=Lentilactobacillus terminaliae TaxID=3003483 RepID=A0ACD5DGW7_9LACO|nr:metallophosphoesterase [Lentilactobacillus sp. SPB1-3]MCZ0976860.1 metallophosphoesterase [Lentilactobacillus sp. SPB1-3]
MVKIAVTSDNHFDLNNVDVNDIIDQQHQMLSELGIQYYLIAGDLFNDFQLSVKYVQQLQETMPEIKVLFVAGNHDMVKNVSYEQLEQGEWPGYLNNRYIDVPDSDVRIIGLNGWYDYSFATNEDKTSQQFLTWKNTYWIDRLITQPMTDEKREDIVLQQLQRQLELAKDNKKKVVLMTHFVPNVKFIRYSDDFRFWNMANAMLGSTRVGQLIDKYKVPAVVFGHIHNRLEPVKYGATTYYNGAVGYHRKRHNEWQSDDFITEWQMQLKKFELF